MGKGDASVASEYLQNLMIVIALISNIYANTKELRTPVCKAYQKPALGSL